MREDGTHALCRQWIEDIKGVFVGLLCRQELCGLCYEVGRSGRDAQYVVAPTVRASGVFETGCRVAQ